MTAATDTPRGDYSKFEDFDVTAIADLPEIDIQAVTGETRAVVAAGENGQLRHAIATSDDDDVGATTFGALNYRLAHGGYMEARFKLSSVTDTKFFIGFGDSIASADETSFSATTDAVTIDTMTDAIGLLIDGDATTAQFWCVAGNTDSVTLAAGQGTASFPKASTWYTARVEVGEGARQAKFTVFGPGGVKLVDYDAVLGPTATTPYVSTAATLVPGVWCYEQGTAFNLDLDYLEGKTTRGGN